MSNETIMLAKNLNLKKMTYPCSASEKLDGVPAVFTCQRQSNITAKTRQGEDILSVIHIKQWLWDKLPMGHSIIGELHVQGLPFKDIGGLVRRSTQSPELVLNVFDYLPDEHETNLSYADRMECMVMSEVGKYIYDEMDGPVRVIPGKHIKDEQELLSYTTLFTSTNPDSEGLIFRPLHGKESIFAAGKRSWGFQRYKAEETVDLKIVGFHEAVEGDTKKPKGMLGRIVCDYKGTEIGVGPGALTHEERIDMWRNPRDYIYNIIEVAYKPDPSYGALREARFKRFRNDKQEPNIE